MRLTRVGIVGYCSIRRIHFPLRQLTVLVGANGVGKTNLYQALQLVRACALGTIAEDVARAGGLGSIFWAGELSRSEKPRVELQVELEQETTGPTSLQLTYRIELGFPTIVSAAFPREAQVKYETLTTMHRGRKVVLLEREGPIARARNSGGGLELVDEHLLASDTALSRLSGSAGFAEIESVRFALAQWRFYHSFRSDPDSPLRRPGLPITSPTLHADGSNLAAVFATLRHIRGDSADLDEVIEQAFPGAALVVPAPDEAAEFAMVMPDLPKRRFRASELSDGTLQFMALAGALLSYRLPPFIALNEPETSLHPTLLPALAKLIAKAAARSQIWVVTHSQPLAQALEEEAGVAPREIVRRDGATWIEGLTQLGGFAETDPSA